jgi:chorismate synthase
MARRAPGKDLLSTARKEPDIPVFTDGVTDSVITDNTINAVIYNTNQNSKDYNTITSSFIPRPSHADFSAKMKYGDSVDLRGGGHFSGRLTAPLCIAGGICIQILKKMGIHIGAHLYSVGNEYDEPFDPVNVSKELIDKLHFSAFPTVDPHSAQKMQEEILSAKKDGDSVGAVIECAAIGLPYGLGEHMFMGVENRISSIIFGIPAVKGIEFGNGFECSKKRGSENNDSFYTDGKKIYTILNITLILVEKGKKHLIFMVKFEIII